MDAALNPIDWINARRRGATVYSSFAKLVTNETTSATAAAAAAAFIAVVRVKRKTTNVARGRGRNEGVLVIVTTTKLAPGDFFRAPLSKNAPRGKWNR